MMESLVQAYPAHFTQMLKLLEGSFGEACNLSFDRVLIAGMGGSGMGGILVSNWANAVGSMPVNVCQGYNLPNWVNANTLVIVSSYSGNTEETLAIFGEAAGKGAQLICISAGGHLLELSEEMGLMYIQLPGNIPSPRAALAFSTTALTFVLNWAGVLPSSCLSDLAEMEDFLRKEQLEIKAKAKQISELINNKIPVFYVPEGFEAVAVRWRQQINENAKFLAWHHVIPEMNHNELVGWRDNHQNVAAVFLKSRFDHPRNLARFSLTREVVSEFTDTVVEVYAKGNNYIQRIQYLIHLGDWISIYLSELRNRDVMEVKVIDYLKGALSELK